MKNEDYIISRKYHGSDYKRSYILVFYGTRKIRGRIKRPELAIIYCNNSDFHGRAERSLHREYDVLFHRKMTQEEYNDWDSYLDIRDRVRMFHVLVYGFADQEKGFSLLVKDERKFYVPWSILDRLRKKLFGKRKWSDVFDRNATLNKRLKNVQKKSNFVGVQLVK